MRGRGRRVGATLGALLLSGVPLLLALCLCAPVAATMEDEPVCHRAQAGPSLDAPCCCAPVTLAQCESERPLDLSAPERPLAGAQVAPAGARNAVATALPAPRPEAEPPPPAPPAAAVPLRA